MTNEISQQLSTGIQKLSQIQNLLIKSTNQTIKQSQSQDLFSLSNLLQESVNSKINDFNQYQQTIFDLMKIFYYEKSDFSFEKASETTSNINKLLNTFQTNIILPMNQQDEMGFIDAFNFLFHTCINFYETLMNISSLLFEQPKSYSFLSIGSKMESDVYYLNLQLYNLSTSILGLSSNLSEKSTFEQIINVIITLVVKSFDDISKHFSHQESSIPQGQQKFPNKKPVSYSLFSFFNYLLDDSNQSFPIISKIYLSLDETIQPTKFKSLHEFLFSFSNKFEDFINMYGKKM